MTLTLQRAAPFSAAVLLAAAVPVVFRSNYLLDVGINSLIIIALAVSFDLVVGRIGALSFAQPVFFGFGAYTAAIMATTVGGGFWIESLAAIAGALLLSLAIGIPAFRLNLHAFAIGTIGFVTIAQLVAQNWISVTGGPLCIAAIPPMDLGFGIMPQTLRAQYYVVLAIAAVILLLTALIVTRRIGLAFTAVRDDAVLAASQGLIPLNLRLIAFGVSAMMSAVAGVFSAHFQSVICPDSLSSAYTVTLLIIAFVGGRGSFRGLLTAAVIFTIAPQVLRVADEWRLSIFGLMLLATVLTVPDGFERIFQLVGARLRRTGDRLVHEAVPANSTIAVFPRRPANAGPHIPIEGGSLRVENLSKAYRGVKAVKDVSFDVQAGEFVGFIGPNGSGKSTTIDCLTGITRPDSGRVFVDGTEVTNWSPNRLAKAGLVRTFQATRTYASLDIRQNLTVSALARASLADEWRQYLRSQSEREEIADRISHLIGILNLSHVEKRQVGELSYGQRKLVQFASALVVPPKILLLDEPLSGVNPTVANMFKEQISALNRDGLTVMLVEHNLEVIVGLSQRLIVLDQGAKIADGAPRSVMAEPHVQEAYLGR